MDSEYNKGEIFDEVRTQILNRDAETVSANWEPVSPPRPAEDASRYVNRTIRQWVTMLPLRLIDLERHKLLSKSDLIPTVEARLSEKGFVDSLMGLDRAFWQDELKKELTPCLSYAILSHRWCSKEPDLQSATRELSAWLPRRLSDSSVEHTPHPDPALQKLIMFCRISHTLGYRLAWTDTCCIDKTSSTEYQESVNSMFAWYRRAHVCIVHLAQTGKAPSQGKSSTQSQPFYYLDDNHESIAIIDRNGDKVSWGEEWFSRGWTLQELLAPSASKFHTSDWEELIPGSLNDKHHIQFPKLLASTTDIPEDVIRYFDPHKKLSFNVKIRWVSKRMTTREEDIVYCLMGIFELHMPILYGEGCESAFFRFQSEYMKVSDDCTIFHWHGKPSIKNTLIASHPDCFQEQIAIQVKWNVKSLFEYKQQTDYSRILIDILVVCHLELFTWGLVWRSVTFGLLYSLRIYVLPHYMHDVIRLSPWVEELRSTGLVLLNTVQPELGFSLTNVGIRITIRYCYVHAMRVDESEALQGLDGKCLETYKLKIETFSEAVVKIMPGQITEEDKVTWQLRAVFFGDTMILLKQVASTQTMPRVLGMAMNAFVIILGIMGGDVAAYLLTVLLVFGSVEMFFKVLIKQWDPNTHTWTRVQTDQPLKPNGAMPIFRQLIYIQ